MSSLKNPRFFLYSAGILLLLAIALNWQLLNYATLQGIGQLQIVWNSRPVSEVLNDPTTPDSIINRLKYIQQVRSFAMDSLGLSPTDNYSTYFDQENRELMWVVTACEPYSLREKIWEFPFIGKVPYKGFFSVERAKNEAYVWKNKGYDVNVRNPGGWSTLGWFKDPILSGMLTRSKGDLASLIIHELAHSTIYVKDSSNFNENLASFIGDEGAKKFLISTFGKHAQELKEFEQEDRDYKKWVDHFLRGANLLDSLYKSTAFKKSAESIRQLQKQNLIRLIVHSTDTLEMADSVNYSKRRWMEPPNNAFFMSFIRYQAMQTDFSLTYKIQFKGDIRSMIDYYRKKYPNL
jgi:predicted aminopeptidase